MDNGEAGTWTGVAEAAAQLGTSPAAIRKRIKRGTLEARRGNDGTYRILLTSTARDVPAPGRHLDAGRTGEGTALDGVTLVERAARAEGELAGLREALARADAAMAAEARRSAELLARADRLEGELAQARRSWIERVLEEAWRR